MTTQGYLAAGIGARVDAVNAALDLMERIEPTPRDRVVTGALVELEEPRGTRWLVVLPGGDGTALGEVVVVSPEAPIARSIWGLAEDDEAGDRAVVSVH